MLVGHEHDDDDDDEYDNDGLGLVNMMMMTLMMVRTEYRETGADRHIIWDHPLSLCSILSYCVQSSLSCRDWFLALFISTIIMISMMIMMIY